MPEALLEIVESDQLGALFIERLGWSIPTMKRPLTVRVEQSEYVVTQVAQYHGLGVWQCPDVPKLRHQRAIDRAVAQQNTERLVIFTGPDRQQWRWPRYKSQRALANPRLISHTHMKGEPDSSLLEKLLLIQIAPGSDVTVPELLNRMRTAFDVESERASVAAARLMGRLYALLEDQDVPEHTASLLLARILFLMFGDDTGMWPNNQFATLLRDHTDESGSDLAKWLTALFTAADTPTRRRPTETPEAIAAFPYINGGIFRDPLEVPELNAELRSALLDACAFDWGQISPAVFGSMFQTVKSKTARRELGEHYTSEAEILKTISPLFLDELHDQLEAAWDSKSALTRLHNRLKDLRFLDPACGCGNFLIVAYRELRHLELELLKRRRDLDQLDGVSTGKNRAQLVVDASDELHITLDQFHGIEIEPWPARIAETAMLLVDHQSNLEMETEIGDAPSRLPIELAPRIHVGNALRTDWAHLVTPADTVYIFGNPPFSGQYTATKQQKDDAKHVWGGLYNGYLDYVTSWYKKALDYYGSTHNGRWAFVSTNSISQGEAAAYLWRPIIDAGWRCRFAHRSMQWQSEATGKAAVHVSIIGFDRGIKRPPVAELWTYPEGGQGDPTRYLAANINPYLIDYRNVFVEPSTNPISAALDAVRYGSKPTDDGQLMVSGAELDEILADPVAAKYLRRFVGARELLHDQERWCLWLADSTPKERRSSRVLRTRIQAVREMRLDSPKAATNKKAATPWLFDENRQPNAYYLAIPRHASEHRLFFVAAYLEPDVICGDANFLAPDPDGYLLGVLSSSQFITWQKTIGGRIKSDIRFSNTFTYNTFPMPTPKPRARQALCKAAHRILDVRDSYPDRSLAELYDPDAMPPELMQAHFAVDLVVDALFGLEPGASLPQRQHSLFEHYEELTGR